MRNDLKSKKWQDVTLEELNSRYEGVGFFCELPNPMTFYIARYMNACAYGVHGEGIDVRCSHADEAVEIYYSSVHCEDLKRKFTSKQWIKVSEDKHNYVYKKGDTKVTLRDDCGSVGYMECDFITDKPDTSFDVCNYYDDDFIDTTEQLVKDMFINKLSRILLNASRYINEEGGVAERFMNGKDTFTKEDCVYLLKGKRYLDEAMALLKERQPINKETIIRRIANMSLEEFNKFINDYHGNDKKNIVVYPFNSETIASIVKEGNDENFSINMEIGRLQDNYIVVTKRYSEYGSEMKIVGLGDDYECWCTYFDYETIADAILKNDSLRKMFEQYK